jgi:hypothetical protein
VLAEQLVDRFEVGAGRAFEGEFLVGGRWGHRPGFGAAAAAIGTIPKPPPLPRAPSGRPCRAHPGVVRERRPDDDRDRLAERPRATALGDAEHPADDLVGGERETQAGGGHGRADDQQQVGASGRRA